MGGDIEGGVRAWMREGWVKGQKRKEKAQKGKWTEAPWPSDHVCQAVSVETTASMSIKGNGSVTPGAELC